MKWTKISGTNELPVGTGLVKLAPPTTKPYQVAYVDVLADGSRMTVVGGHFGFDQNPVIAYAAFEECDCG